jgi:predicted nucleotidyltransferase
MGQVFTWDSIQAGRVPKLESFQRVAADLRETLSSEPTVVSALFFGSVIRGDFNIRSDIDCVVLYDTGGQNSAMGAMHHVDRMAHSLYVPINYTPCDTALARTRFHALGVAFVRHLQAAIDAGGLIKGNLVDLLAPTAPVEQELESYISRKMYSLQAALAQMASFDEKELARFFRKAFEAPMHIARKMLIYEGTLEGDSKQDVRERYRETMPTHLGEQFDYLLSVDSWYNLELESQLGNPDEDQYVATLSSLQSELPKVLEFLRANIRRLNDAC